ncbi:coiled-coil-helix-coiled-coil-helix domain containing 3b isoform X2 [Onychostoma macrolepis]|uniref:coiled-coil-helix-coiled-coil-helix domain containing 3b isoform X2 n=1 Tax=Onychostoma macrolepis TaxID=369639 RepID=UPI00272AF9B4|nr:coiled-coil-helix-coiled-coil-helix domain containing 3b isoform X2 [Onychostoma macrolepis]
MGGNGSSRHVSFDPDSAEDEEGVTFVKGIRLSQRVIDRMKDSPPVVHPQASTKSSTQSTPAVAPLVEQLVPGEHHGPIIPHPPSYASTLVPPPVSEPITPFVPLVPGTEKTSAPPSPENFPNPPPTGDEHVAILVPDPQPAVLPAEPINVPSQVSSEPLTAPSPPPAITSEPVAIPPPPTTDPLTEPVTSTESSVEPVIVSSEPIATPSSPTLAAQPTSGESMDLPVEPEVSSSPISIPAPIQSVLEESAVSQSGSASSVVLPDEMPSKMRLGPISTGEPAVPCVHLVEEPVVPSFIDQLEVFPPQTHVVNEEKLRKQIREDLQKLLNEEMKMAEHNMRQELEEEKAKAKAQARAAAQLQIQDEVQKLLEEEKASYQQTLADAIRREKLNVQDEHLITQYYAQKLEEKEKDLENQDALFREQIAKMQKKMARFTKVTAENYKKGLEDAHNRFRRCQIKPVCSDLQSQILKCYAENKGQTMSCSNIASLYIQCVDRARQDKKLSTGG